MNPRTFSNVFFLVGFFCIICLPTELWGVKWEFPHLQAELSFGSALLLTVFFFSSSSFQGKWGWWTPFVLSDICIKTSAWHYRACKASRSDGSAPEPYLNSLDLFMPLSPPLILPMQLFHTGDAGTQNTCSACVALMSALRWPQSTLVPHSCNTTLHYTVWVINKWLEVSVPPTLTQT